MHIISINSGRSDYVIEGESAQLSCHYLFTKPEEKIVSVRWEKDGQDVCIVQYSIVIIMLMRLFVIFIYIENML